MCWRDIVKGEWPIKTEFIADIILGSSLMLTFLPLSRFSFLLLLACMHADTQDTALSPGRGRRWSDRRRRRLRFSISPFSLGALYRKARGQRPHRRARNEPPTSHVTSGLRLQNNSVSMVLCSTSNAVIANRRIDCDS